MFRLLLYCSIISDWQCDTIKDACVRHGASPWYFTPEVKDHTISHLLQYSLLSPFQAGFRPGFSTQDVLIYITDKWKKAIDDKQVSGAVFLDVVKVFDRVNHDILLPYYGITACSVGSLMCNFVWIVVLDKFSSLFVILFNLRKIQYTWTHFSHRGGCSL